MEADQKALLTPKLILKYILFLFTLFIFSFSSFGLANNTTTTTPTPKLDTTEVKVMRDIMKKLGKRDWEIGEKACNEDLSKSKGSSESEAYLTCDCSFHNNSSCHIVSIYLKALNISASVPSEFSKLRYLTKLDLSRNHLNGSIPREWSTMKLIELSLMGNRLFGPFPKALTNITTLTNVSIEGNLFTGPIPPEIGKMVNLQKLVIASNGFTGKLPVELSKLTNLTDMRISDNNFSGRIPDFIGNWTMIEKLQIQGCSLEGPIPSTISALTKLADLRITDLKGKRSQFPPLSNMKAMKTLILRKCLLHGEIPDYIGLLSKLKNLDLSYNDLTGGIPASFSLLEKVDFMYLTGNKLTGTIPRWAPGRNNNLDISNNNFTWESSSPVECPRGSVNFVESYAPSTDKQKIHPCLKRDFPCPASRNQHRHSLHINCGGKEVDINGQKYEADREQRGASMFYSGQEWALSSTGNFLDNDMDADVYTETNTSAISNVTLPVSELYTTARASPLSLTYYGLCLLNGNYTVKLHFAEITFTNDMSYYSLGKRMFDVFIQEKLVMKDFNIKEQAGGAGIPIVKNFTVEVTSHTLKIHFYWAGKGTTGIPERGFYGPLISAISVDPNFKPPKIQGKQNRLVLMVGILCASLILCSIIFGVLKKKGLLGGNVSTDKELRDLDQQTGIFSLRQIKAATKNFDAENKLGEGGFGAVYKGQLSDGTIIAVKQLSAKSKQGNREFVNEIGMISALQHPNLVKLHGCCVEGNQLMLVYEYMENNCLSRALFSKKMSERLMLDWSTRKKICIGIARGLAFLHEESRIKIVHRDIKTSNVLLDKDFSAKISDFGLAKLNEDDNTHISTRIAGTIGYMAPEYAMRGYLTDKADIYSFGVVALEIVSGKSNTNYRPTEEFVYLLDWAYVLQERGNLLELVDPALGSQYSSEEAILMLNVALLCTNASPTLRPKMSQVVSMLEGRTEVQDLLSDTGFSSNKSDTRGSKFHFWMNRTSGSQSLTMNDSCTDSSSSCVEPGERSELLRSTSIKSGV